MRAPYIFHALYKSHPRTLYFSCLLYAGYGVSDGRYTQYEGFECTVIDENETSDSDRDQDWAETTTVGMAGRYLGNSTTCSFPGERPPVTQCGIPHPQIAIRH